MCDNFHVSNEDLSPSGDTVNGIDPAELNPFDRCDECGRYEDECGGH